MLEALITSFANSEESCPDNFLYGDSEFWRIDYPNIWRETSFGEFLFEKSSFERLIPDRGRSVFIITWESESVNIYRVSREVGHFFEVETYNSKGLVVEVNRIPECSFAIRKLAEAAIYIPTDYAREVGLLGAVFNLAILKIFDDIKLFDTIGRWVGFEVKKRINLGRKIIFEITGIAGSKGVGEMIRRMERYARKNNLEVVFVSSEGNRVGVHSQPVMQETACICFGYYSRSKDRLIVPGPSEENNRWLTFFLSRVEINMK